MERITVGGFVTRLVAALALVGLTYNPSGWSYAHWVAGAFPHLEPLQAIAGLVLIGGWAFFVHATWRALGAFGVLLGVALCAAFVWLFVSRGWLQLDGGALGWIADGVAALLLAVGISWSLVERRVTGQVVVDEGERR
jgi:hypothetical protein